MPGYGAHYWAERTADNRRKSHPKFRGQHTADVVVIGGGLTGCAAAAAIAGAGLDVILLEAERMATGSTAGGIGAILPQPDASFRVVEATVGRRVARTAWEEARRSAVEFAAVAWATSRSCSACCRFLAGVISLSTSSFVRS